MLAIGVAAALAASLVLPGCAIEVGLATVVDKDGSGRIGLRLAADKELQGALSQATAGLGGVADLGSFIEGLEGGLPDDADAIFALLVGSIPTDWSVDQGTDSDGARWMSLSHDFDDPQDLEDLARGRVLSMLIDPERFSLTRDEGFFRTTTAYSAAVGLSGALAGAEEADAGLLREVLGEVLVFENRVTLPGVSKDHNADRVEGDTLVWTVGPAGYREMRASSVSYDWTHIGIVASAGIVGLLVLSLVVVLLVRRRRRRRGPQSIPPPPQSPDAAAPDAAAPDAAAPDAAAYMLAYVAEDEEPSEER